MSEILVTGGAGQVGGFIAGQSRDGFEFRAPGRSELDLADQVSIERVLAARPWSAVINTAAYTAVDQAEAEPSAAWLVNAQGPQWLAEAAARANVPLVHVSTDYVFSGALDRPYEEDDDIGPLGVYGASKAAGEARIRAAALRHAIVRTSWVVSARGQNFVKTMLRLARERDAIDVVADQHGAPTHAGDLADALMTIAIRLATDPASPAGTFHFTNDGFTTWADLAEEAFRLSADLGGPSAAVRKVDSAAFPRPAPRPRNSRLAPGRLPDAFCLHRRSWRAALADIVEQIITARQA